MTKTRTFNDNSHSLKRRKRKLMGLYGAPRDVAPLFSISSLPSLESRIRSMIRSERVLLYIFSGAVRGGVHTPLRAFWSLLPLPQSTGSTPGESPGLTKGAV